MLTRQRGQALIIVLLMTSVIFMLGGAALAMSTAARNTAVLETDQKKAYYIAEAGVEKVLARIKSDSLWVKGLVTGQEYNLVPGYLAPDYASGKIIYARVKKLSSDNNRVTLSIECRGSFRQAGRTVKTVVEICGPLEFYPGVMIGPAGWNFDLNWYRENADYYFSGSQEWSDQMLGELRGVIFVDGDLGLRGSYSGLALVVVNGRVNIDGFLAAASGQDSLWIISNSPITVSNKAALNANSGLDLGAFVYTTAAVHVKCNVNLAGGIRAIDLFLDEGASITEQPGPVLKQPDWVTTTARVLSWEEI